MFTPYTVQDGTPPRDPAWLHEEIFLLRGERAPISSMVKLAVDEFGLVVGGESYKHYVPYAWIYNGLYNQLTARVSRSKTIATLKVVLNALNIRDLSNLDPTLNRASYDSWVSWCVEAIADWPLNIFRWGSAGDARGTQIDEPDNAPEALLDRLKAAHATLKRLGLATPPTG